MLQLSRRGSDGDLLAWLRNTGNPVEALAQGLLQYVHFFQFAVHQIQLGMMVEMTDPIEQLRLPGMGGEAAEGVDLRFDSDALVEHFH